MMSSTIAVAAPVVPVAPEAAPVVGAHLGLRSKACDWVGVLFYTQKEGSVKALVYRAPIGITDNGILHALPLNSFGSRVAHYGETVETVGQAIVREHFPRLQEDTPISMSFIAEATGTRYQSEGKLLRAPRNVFYGVQIAPKIFDALRLDGLREEANKAEAKKEAWSSRLCEMSLDELREEAKKAEAKKEAWSSRLCEMSLDELREEAKKAEAKKEAWVPRVVDEYMEWFEAMHGIVLNSRLPLTSIVKHKITLLRNVRPAGVPAVGRVFFNWAEDIFRKPLDRTFLDRIRAEITANASYEVDFFLAAADRLRDPAFMSQTHKVDFVVAAADRPRDPEAPMTKTPLYRPPVSASYPGDFPPKYRTGGTPPRTVPPRHSDMDPVFDRSGAY
eukprot:TRINITY_DN505_c0_g1_i2.p1 TRINITY_DN505_c0_g1~~TRINITY_DN505_c0_g1_i2.p1  ORF type:complete len:390 (+),score=53.45 TRINITY_DN505_c0_g1_i2:264-1433(+)